jgi:DNA modification methylase
MSQIVLEGDARKVLEGFPEGFFHCAVTSPPYYSPKKGLRNYGVRPLEWDDGWVGDLGKEPNPLMYADHLVELYHPLKNALRDDGTFWLNIGDSHAGSGCGPSGKTGCIQNQGERQGHTGEAVPIPQGYKRKEIFATPFLVGEALRRDGWYWRSIIPWLKHNGMPGSYKDRPVSTIEFILILTKTPTNYYDYVAVMQKSSESYQKDKRPAGVLRQRVNPNTKYDREENQFKKQDGTGNSTYTGFNQRWKENGGGNGTRLLRESDFFFQSFQGLWLDEENEPLALVMNTKGYKEKHFAAFPVALPEICILASTSEKGVCPECRAPWARDIKKTSTTDHTGKTECAYEKGSTANRLALLRQAARANGEEYETMIETTGWHPTCSHNLDPVPATVLDPFAGSCATGVACEWHKRDFIGIELKHEYCELGRKRMKENK